MQASQTGIAKMHLVTPNVPLKPFFCELFGLSVAVTIDRAWALFRPQVRFLRSRVMDTISDLLPAARSYAQAWKLGSMRSMTS